MWQRNSSYYFLIFLLIAVSFAAFLPSWKRTLAKTSQDVVRYHMDAFGSELLYEKEQGKDFSGTCVNPSAISLSYLAIEELPGVSLVCRENEDGESAAFFVEFGRGEWYCVDSYGYAGYVDEPTEPGAGYCISPSFSYNRARS